MERSDIVIVGAGHAGVQLASTLRQSGFSGGITVLSAENDLPYERPPLSKDYLLKEKDFERILLKPKSFWSEQSIDLRLGHCVMQINPSDKIVSCANGAQLHYGTLVWAAGGAPRLLPIPGAELPSIFYLRDKADADALDNATQHAQRFVIIGGGYIGLEAAASLSKRGKQITVLEAEDRLLARVAGPEISDFFMKEHQAHGVTIELSLAAERIEKTDTGLCVIGKDGRHFEADSIVVGIGIIPTIQPLIDAGARHSNGVEIDAQCRTSLPNIYAIGDCAAHINAFADNARIRLESVQNANDQARCVAHQIISGEEQAYHAIPWFWSNQYDIRLQTMGLNMGYDQTVLRGSPEDKSFSVIYLRHGAVIALDCVNSPRDYVQGKALVHPPAQIDPERLADTTTTLKELLSASA